MDVETLNDATFELIAARFRVLGDPMRLRILHAIGKEEVTVGTLVNVLGAKQANVSKHLGLLLDAGIVRRRKDGLNAYYTIADESIFNLCELVCSSLDERLAAQRAAVIRYPGQ